MSKESSLFDIHILCPVPLEEFYKHHYPKVLDLYAI